MEPWHLIEAPIATASRFVGMTEAPAALADAFSARADATKRVRIPFVPRDTWMRAAREACMVLADAVVATLDAGARPLIVGGECTLVAGSLHGAGGRFDDLVLVYLDAHGDFNTLATTPSHFMGGMCLAHVCGKHVAPLLWPGVRAFPEERVCLIGARDLDPGEAVNLDRSRVRRFPFDGAAMNAREVLGVARRHPAWIHLDLDVVDPKEMYAVNFPVANGCSFAALETLLADIARVASVRGVEICAYDPRQDPTRALPERIAGAVAPLLS